jgi:hypothetical protein
MRASVLLLGVLLLTIPGVVGAQKVRRVDRATFEARLDAIQTTGNSHRIGMNIGYALMGVRGMVQDGAKLALTKHGALARDRSGSARVTVDGDRITVTRRDFARNGRAGMYDRDTIRLLSPGLAVNTNTLRVAGHRETRHYVMWKNSSAYVKAPLSQAQVDQLRQQLGSTRVKLGARAKALFGYRSGRAVPGLELQRALDRMGIANSVDWR